MTNKAKLALNDVTTIGNKSHSRVGKKSGGTGRGSCATLIAASARKGRKGRTKDALDGGHVAEDTGRKTDEGGRLARGRKRSSGDGGRTCVTTGEQGRERGMMRLCTTTVAAGKCSFGTAKGCHSRALVENWSTVTPNCTRLSGDRLVFQLLNNFIKSIIFQHSRESKDTECKKRKHENANNLDDSEEPSSRCELVNTAKIARRTVEDINVSQLMYHQKIRGGFRSFVAFGNEAWNTVVSGATEYSCMPKVHVNYNDGNQISLPQQRSIRPREKFEIKESMRPKGFLAGVRSAHVHFHSFRSMCMGFTRISDTCKAQGRGSCRLWGVAGMQSNSIHNLQLRNSHWNCAPASNVAAKRIFGVDRKLLGQNVIGAKESFVVRNIALERRGKRKDQRETSAQFSDVATTSATASFANAEELNCAAVKKQLLQSRISIVANSTYEVGYGANLLGPGASALRKRGN
ncbi:hypothetical protein G5I_14613 [Acromyrmex echinatior]|uniref:Uncharacterized protein n=1 Tax=Acromyrmex echinatior TaxID=103372 RepID=F4X8D4_ACREC|nr:hypothetical protein G5I_14613 [Acromyrmex echinatior]